MLEGYLCLFNYTFGVVCLYLGLVETWLAVTLVKSFWAMHVHTNWEYDLRLLNHPNRHVRGVMYAFCHVLTFPNQHHHHHARNKNSTKNLQNMLAIYDWLLWGTLVIEKERPQVYGWRAKAEERNPLRRFLRRPLKVATR